MYFVIGDNNGNDENVLMLKNHTFIFRSKNYWLVLLNWWFNSGDDLFPILTLSIIRILFIEVPPNITLILGKAVADWPGSSLFCSSKKSFFKN